ncbi:hypothetical protein BRC82_04225 [Halobacteriales archaeon QS_1_67_19]|nr:MAG: hypothetical protein BRC82_04225 [Halobacteriales archaeon QS_1_67_19]
MARVASGRLTSAEITRSVFLRWARQILRDGRTGKPNRGTEQFGHLRRWELTETDSDRIPGLGPGYRPEDRKLVTGVRVDENVRPPIRTVGDERGIDDEDAVAVTMVKHPQLV